MFAQRNVCKAVWPFESCYYKIKLAAGIQDIIPPDRIPPVSYTHLTLPTIYSV